MFEGFTRKRIEATGASINLRIGGSGPPLLLLHGNPLTHVMWHKIAPRLAEEFTVVGDGPARLRRQLQAARAASRASATRSARWRATRSR